MVGALFMWDVYPYGLGTSFNEISFDPTSTDKFKIVSTDSDVDINFISNGAIVFHCDLETEFANINMNTMNSISALMTGGAGNFVNELNYGEYVDRDGVIYSTTHNFVGTVNFEEDVNLIFQSIYPPHFYNVLISKYEFFLFFL